MAKQKIRAATRANTRKVMEIFNDHMEDLDIADAVATPGRVTYDQSTGEISFKLTIRLPLENGEVAESKDVRAFNTYKHRHPELTDVEIGSVFKMDRACYEITGYRPRAYKRPLLAKNLNTGKMFVFPVSSMRSVEWQ